MKFKKVYGRDRELTFVDRDGDQFGLTIYHDPVTHAAILGITDASQEVSTAVGMSRKQLRTLANKILKELDR